MKLSTDVDKLVIHPGIVVHRGGDTYRVSDKYCYLSDTFFF